MQRPPNGTYVKTLAAHQLFITIFFLANILGHHEKPWRFKYINFYLLPMFFLSITIKHGLLITCLFFPLTLPNLHLLNLNKSTFSKHHLELGLIVNQVLIYLNVFHTSSILLLFLTTYSINICITVSY